MNHDQLATRLGLARSSITNLINLLELPQEIQEGIRTGQLSEAHAKLIKGIRGKEKQIALFKQIVAMGLSLKATEALIREWKEESEPAEPEKSPAEKQSEEKTAHVRGLEDELRKRLATPIEIRLRGKDKGQIIIGFETNDDFMRVMEVLRK